jgi:hypothetical protein
MNCVTTYASPAAFYTLLFLVFLEAYYFVGRETQQALLLIIDLFSNLSASLSPLVVALSLAIVLFCGPGVLIPFAV